MTGDLEDFARWRGSVDDRLGKLEAKVETEAHLRAAMDRDMGTLSAKFGVQERLIQAISETQSDHTRQLRTIDGRLEKVEGKLDLVHVGVQAIHTLLTGLTADGTHEDDQMNANTVDTDPGALPGSRGECR
jgi:hypothetical protein